LRAVCAALLVLAALALSGCGTEGLTDEGGDVSQGKLVFTQQCGRCHALREARTTGTIGPNLDDAFAGPRSEGFDEETIREVVRHQIDYPIPPMPEDIVTDEQADAVAAYVAEVAANRDAKISLPAGAGSADDPKTLFASNCGSCHVLADAGTTGTIGPNLDQGKPSLQTAITQITNGGGGMPAFKGQLSAAEIRALAQYLVRVAGKT
jgi:cbb3-type cytochrome c oxidase subunit III